MGESQYQTTALKFLLPIIVMRNWVKGKYVHRISVYEAIFWSIVGKIIIVVIAVVTRLGSGW